MDERASLLFSLTEFEGVDVTLIDSGVQVVIEAIAVKGGCPGCGVLLAGKDRRHCCVVPSRMCRSAVGRSAPSCGSGGGTA